MNALKILIFSLIISSSVNGQEYKLVDNNGSDLTGIKIKNGYLPILNSDQTWISIASSGFEPPSTFQYTFSDDSILLQTNYYFERIQSKNEDGSESFVNGHYREVDGKIYEKLEGSNNERIILDMSLIVGDSIYIDQGSFSSTLFVVRVDTITYNDSISRKRIELKCSQNPDDFGSKYWVEGIGELFSGINCVLDGGQDYINCVLGPDGERIYSQSTNGADCWVTTNVVDLPLTNLFVFPNPSRDKLNISGLSKQISNGIIYNSNGQIVSHFCTEQIDISTLPSGGYFIKLIDKGNRFYSTKFVKGH